MKGLTGRLFVDPKYLKVAEWGRLISITGSAQVLIQILSLVSGILIVRYLPTQEYALYTLANTMFATTLVLTDSGIGAGVLSNGGKVWEDKQQLGGVIAAGVKLRKKFATIILLFALPALFYLLMKHQTGWKMSLVIILSLIPAFYAALTDALYEIPLKLRQDIAGLQKNQLFANISRFVFLVIGLLFLPFTFIAMLATGITRLLANIKLKRRAEDIADLGQPVDQEVEKDIINMLKKTLPSTIYYCASAQITIWLISLFGNTTAIAQVGALERVISALGLITVMFSTLVIPRFARLKADPEVLIGRFVQVLVVLAAISFGVCLLCYWLSDQILFVLGSPYMSLHHELLLITISGCLGLIAGIVNYISVARGWPIAPGLFITVSLLTQVILICTVDLMVLSNVLFIAIANSSISLLLYCFYFLYRAFKLKKDGHGAGKE